MKTRLEIIAEQIDKLTQAIEKYTVSNHIAPRIMAELERSRLIKALISSNDEAEEAEPDAN